MTAVMAEIEIDMSRHVAKSFEELEDTSFDFVITLSPEVQHRAVEMTRTMSCEVIFWNTFDPTVLEGSRGVRLQGIRDVRNGLAQRILDQFFSPETPPMGLAGLDVGREEP
jgi:protein-tyrosine-phosphatase